MSTCTFCRIISEDLPCSRVYDDADIIAFLDIHPVIEGHTLIVPKLHIQSLTDLPQALLERVAQVGQTVAAHLKTVIPGCKGITLSLADGEVAGQEVPHVHLHVIPRKEGDDFGWKFPAGWGAVADREALEAIAKALRDLLIGRENQVRPPQSVR
jgi:histidine triad (HIT) family protein